MHNRKKNIVVVGASGHGMVVADILSQMSEYHVAGFIDAFKEKGTICGGDLVVLGAESDLPAIIKEQDIYGGIVAIGDNWSRSVVVGKILAVVPEFRFVNAIHPSCVVSPRAVMGVGNVLSPNVVINANATIGNFCIINSVACIEHDNIMEDYSSVAPRVVTGGNVSIGAFTAVGIGAVIKHRIVIGEQSIIGAGALVLKDVTPYSTWYGVPAKKIRERKAGDKYL